MAMKRLRLLGLVVVCALAAAAPRWTDDKKGAGRVRVSLYRVAPGKQLDFLKWLALQDEAAKEAGLPTVQLYAHLDGDAWDYVGIWPSPLPEQEKKYDEALARRGVKTGFPGALEFRDYLAWHTDTYAIGPTSASDLVALAVK
jgi:hypothetical protein